MKFFPEPQEITLFDSYSNIDFMEKKSIRNEKLANQEYIIRINEKGIEIESSSEQGAFYADITLKQLLNQQIPKRIQHCYIHDYPDFEDRGVLIDVGRYRTPTLKTLYRIVDILSSVKINQLQLYFEGFPFAYPSHPKVWKNRDVLTGEDIVSLDNYCKSKFIELVPCQNGFGHLKHWLARDEYHKLGVSPSGFQMPWGYEKDCATLDPLNPDSLELSKSLYFDILPYFSSNKVNICFDETFELKKAAASQEQLGRMYYDYLMQVYTAIKEKYPDKTILFWSDVIEEHPEYLPKLPKDLIPLVWKYRPYQPTPEMLEVYEEMNQSFYICSTTFTHCTIAGKTLPMMQNVNNCTKYGKLAGAKGYLNTKWGDCGNWDGISVAYFPLVYGGVQGWNARVEHNVELFLNQCVFEDKNGLMAKIAKELGDFFHEEPSEPYYNGNGIMRILYYYQLDEKDHDLDFMNMPPYSDDYFDNVLAHAYKYQKILENTDLQCDDAEAVIAEYTLAIHMLIHGAMLGKYKQQYEGNREKLWDLYDDIRAILAEYRKCWFMRNKNVGLDESLYKLYELKKQYQEHLGTGHIKG